MNKQRSLGFAIITGAAGGIGQALVTEFTNSGYRVIATDIVEQPKDLNCDFYIQVDLAKTVEDEAYANEVFKKINATLDGQSLNVLINNAAIQILGSVDNLSREDWHRTLNTNLLAPFIWTQAFLPELEKHNGNVVNISSIHANLTKKNFVAYATSKAALSGMTKAMAVDLGGRIRVNAIEPAAIETEMLKSGFAGKPELYSQLENCHPQQRIGKPEEVAKLALVLADSEIQFMHGAIIGLDGAVSGRLFDPD